MVNTFEKLDFYNDANAACSLNMYYTFLSFMLSYVKIQIRIDQCHRLL